MSENLDTAGSLSRSRERVRVRARSLRSTPTDAEALLWHHLRDRRMANQKFRRQRPIGPYFADFACLEAKLIVELDGGQHAESEHDLARDKFLRDAGWRVLRFWNADILQNMAEVGAPPISRSSVLASGEAVGGYYVNLRSLGPNRTLVLINGKRLGATTSGVE